jgi:polyphosphate kinase 2 (PPK2 family)
VLPAKGQFGFFNRRHYENGLISRVSPANLMAENLPHFNGTEDATDDFWEMRFHHTRNFEKELAQNGTTILKFYLHLNKEEQKNRLIRRLQTPDKNWKFFIDDLK